MDLRIGLGIDVHRLEADRPCTLGGVTIPSPVGPLGHSDGDAVLHAMCDACLGAAGLDDLGTLFKDTDPAHAGRNSADFAVAVRGLIEDRGLRVISADIVLETNHPKLMPHRAAMRARMATLFGIHTERINLKGKTGEKVDSVGRGESLRATAVVLLGAHGSPS